METYIVVVEEEGGESIEQDGETKGVKEAY